MMRIVLIFLSTIAVVAMAGVESVQPATQETELLRAWESLEYGMFIHYGMSTFAVNEYGQIPMPSTAYAPTDPDVDQWITTAKAGGMKYAVLTVKHCYGHGLWPSKYTDYDVETSSDKTDVVKAFVEACREYDIKPGFYYLIGWDMYHQPKMSYDEYGQFVLDQVGELLTDYGPITELWFDIPWDIGPNTGDVLARLYAHCKQLQPNCLVLLNQGFVDGSRVSVMQPSWLRKAVEAPKTAIWPKDLNNGERIVPPESGHEPRIEFEGATWYLPDEVCDTILQARWFWGQDDDLRPARQMLELYRQSVGRNANFLLNVPPDQSGRIPEAYVTRLREIRTMIEHPESVQDSLVLGRPVRASNVYRGMTEDWGPERALDMDIEGRAGTRWATDESEKTVWLEVDLDGEQTLGRVTACEYLDRIRSWELQIPDGESWKRIAGGTTIGGPGVNVTFGPVKAKKVRLVITDSTGGPTLWDFAVYPPKPRSE